MSGQSSRGVWPLVLIGVVLIAAYGYFTIDVSRDPALDREQGGAAELEALASRDDTNVLFVLVDTMRAGRMGAYGYERDTTPFLDELAETGIRFQRHIAQSSWTKSSMASLWSGLNPTRAGVTKFNHALSREIVTPAEILSDAGFMTVGLYRNGWVHGYFGFDQGFDKYYRPVATSRIDGEVQRLRPNAQAQGSDETLLLDAIEFLRIHGQTSRWFLYLHLMDLHEYTYDAESALFGTAVPDLYDNSLRRTDWVLSKLYAHLGRTGLLDETIVVVLSDHGEAFGEWGFEGHARAVFPQTTETPLIISLPVSLSPGVVVNEPTTNADVWATLLDLMGIKDDRDIDGRSRRPAILAAARGERAPAIADDYSVAFLDENWGRNTDKKRPAVSVVEGDFRYVSGTDARGSAFEVLLSAEDGQRQNVMDQHPEIAERLRAEAERQTAASARYPMQTFELDELQLDQLRALGYELP